MNLDTTTINEIIKRVGALRDAEKFSFIVDYPPPIVRPSITGDEILEKPPIELYVHLPYCKYICDFCSFFKVGGLSEDKIDKYLSAVEKEVALYLDKSDLKSRKISSLFLGGGTPTILSPKQFTRLLTYLGTNLNFDENIEITAESTPDTLNDKILEAMKESGINRLSIGVQDFHDEVLAARNRRHTGQEAIDAYRRARQHGFDKINIDMIYRLPKQTLEGWEQNLKILGKLKPDYVTTYHLRKEQRTPLGRLHKLQFPSKEEAMEMYLMALKFFVNSGYIQIAPNQYAMPQKEFKQQERKWHLGSELLGLGVSAYSSFNGCSYRNIGRFSENPLKSLENYIQSIVSGHLAIESGERLTAREQMHRFAVFGIKTSGINKQDRGIDKKLFYERFGTPVNSVFGGLIEKLKGDNLIEEDANFIKLTLNGLVVAEEVSTMFYSEDVQRRLKEKGDRFGRVGL